MSEIPNNDLKTRDVFGIDSNGCVMVDGGDEGLIKCKVVRLPGGMLKAVPLAEPDNSVDQIGECRRSPTRAERLRGIDQA